MVIPGFDAARQQAITWPKVDLRIMTPYGFAMANELSPQNL